MVMFAHKADIYIRVGTREKEEILAEEKRGRKREIMRLGAKHTRNAYPYFVDFCASCGEFIRRFYFFKLHSQISRAVL